MHTVAQITDIHIGLEGEDTYGIDVRRNLAAIFRAIVAHGADEIVVTGDLCFSAGAAPVYAWLRSQLEATGLPYRVLPGNHDDPAMLAEAFDLRLRDGALYDRRDCNGRREIFLDTSPNRLSETQASFLAESLAGAEGEAIVWMHHPPLLAGVRYMDENHPLVDHARVAAILVAHRAPVHVFVGHYHADVAVSRGAATVYLAPSTFFQIQPLAAGFEVDHRRPGYRLVAFDRDQLRTEVRYLDQGFMLEG